MIDKATYDELASRLERELNENSRIEWYVDRYDARLGDACISDEVAKAVGITPEAHFDLAYKQMEIWAEVCIVCRKLKSKFRVYTYVARALIEDGAPDYVVIVKQLVADQIALSLIESNII